MFKNHLAMIGYNESPNKKAKFWQSYIRSLKGSEDIRAHESPSEYRRPFLLYDEPDTAASRIHTSGYRYLPVHRETYGYSPRPIYSHQYPHYSTYKEPGTIHSRLYDAEKAWNDHLERMKDIDRRYPSRYGLYLRDRPQQVMLPQELEYEPETKPFSLHH